MLGKSPTVICAYLAILILDQKQGISNEILVTEWKKVNDPINRILWPWTIAKNHIFQYPPRSFALLCFYKALLLLVATFQDYWDLEN